MQIHKAYRYELDPTVEQRQYFARCCGTARFVFNRGLASRIERFQTQEGKDKFTTAFDQMKEVVQLKRTSEFSWLGEVDSYVSRYALINLDRAFQNFRKGRKAARQIGFPKFKKKGIRDAFSVMGTTIRVLPRDVKIPKIGLIRSKEVTAVEGRVLYATVSREADRWYIAITTEQDIADPVPVAGPVVGVDLGVKTLATLSDGEILRLPARLDRLQRRLQRESHKHSRKVKGSHNRRKATLQVARAHRKIRNTRANLLHEFTTRLAKTKQTIVLEDLSVKDMVGSTGKVCQTAAQRHGMNRKILSGAFAEVRRQLEYKTKWYGSKLVIADKYFPSSQLCSSCGHRQDMTLDMRTYSCPICNLVVDRDLNAARNLQQYTAMPVGIYACGDERFMSKSQDEDRCLSMKQEEVVYV